ncbi:hypothetical protein L1049_028260 [Liquidambar formosana]|uniref:Uncharacterized protein n=1 Tax=Liquidambar formosana TaxID=63359 RepID=A0AAP0RM72_LIQFO
MDVLYLALVGQLQDVYDAVCCASGWMNCGYWDALKISCFLQNGQKNDDVSSHEYTVTICRHGLLKNRLVTPCSKGSPLFKKQLFKQQIPMPFVVSSRHIMEADKFKLCLECWRSS